MSLQQDRYLARRAIGDTMHTAAATTGIALTEARLIENDIAKGLLTLPEPAPPEPPQEENNMARGRKKAAEAPQPEEIKAPDFEAAVRIYRGDIKPAVEAAGESAQEASQGYKDIKNLGVNTRAARFVFSLERESEEKRNDVLRSLRGMLTAMNIGVTDDLVSQAEGEDGAAPIIPAATPQKLELATLN